MSGVIAFLNTMYSQTCLKQAVKGCNKMANEGRRLLNTDYFTKKRQLRSQNTEL